MRLLSVGSTVIDLFLKPDIDMNDLKQITLNLGDKIPTDLTATKIGGNAANVAVVAKSLGSEVTLYTYLADDFFAKEIEEGLKGQNLNLIAEKVPGKSDFSLIMSVGGDRVIFSHHEKNTHFFKPPQEQPDTIYLTSLADDWVETYQNVVKYAQENNIALALSPGSPQLQDINESLLSAVSNCHYLFTNLEEAKKIAEKTSSNASSPKDLLLHLNTLGPNIISITDGANGAYATDGKTFLKSDAVKGEYIEKTGAGDTYAASFLTWYTQNGNLGKAMKAGALGASSVMKKEGSTPKVMNKEELTQILEEAPDPQPQEL